MTDESKQKIKFSLIGNVRALGSHRSEEMIKKMAESKRGSLHPNFGKHLSEETRQKISFANKLRPPLSEQSRIKRSISLKKVVHTPEWNANVGASKKGFNMTEEQKKKIRNTLAGKYCGDKNGNWKGGISFEPYCPKFNREFKERVRAFFGYKCVECGTPQNGEKLSVHHVNFNKKTCCDNSIPLFVTLCRNCHMKTNHNRPYWEQHFTSLINDKYGGKCYLPREVPRDHVNGTAQITGLVFP